MMSKIITDLEYVRSQCSFGEYLVHTNKKTIEVGKPELLRFLNEPDLIGFSIIFHCGCHYLFLPDGKRKELVPCKMCAGPIF